MIDRFLEDKGVLITGGASGFGKGVAFEFAKRGADLVLIDINEKMLEETSKWIETETRQKVVPIICDVSQTDQVKQMAKQTFQELDNIYILFNNAGICPGFGKDVLKVDEKIWNSTINVNLKGQWLVSKFICRNMRRQSFEPLSGKVILSILPIVNCGNQHFGTVAVVRFVWSYQTEPPFDIDLSAATTSRPSEF